MLQATSLSTQTTKPRLLLADDHGLVIEGFRKLLEADFDLVGTATDGHALLEQAQHLQPDVILLDISMPGLNGLEAARQLGRLVPESKLIFVTMHADQAFVTEAFRAGAYGYLLKHSAASELIFAIREVLKGNQYVTPMVTKGVLHAVLNAALGAPSKTFAGTLSARQREVLQLVAEGHTMKDIAERLRLSTKTVEYHKSRMMERLGLHTTAELTKYAISEGIITL